MRRFLQRIRDWLNAEVEPSPNDAIDATIARVVSNRSAESEAKGSSQRLTE